MAKYVVCNVLSIRDIGDRKKNFFRKYQKQNYSYASFLEGNSVRTYRMGPKKAMCQTVCGPA